MNDPQSTNGLRLLWDIGTAYEFFLTLHVLHTPERYGVRASWAAGIRSRIPAAERKLLEEVIPFVVLPAVWIRKLPAPRDAVSALWTLRQTPPTERISAMLCSYDCYEPLPNTLKQISERRTWEKAELDLLLSTYGEEGFQYTREQVAHYLDWWARPDEFGEGLLSALQAYYQAFFEEEEKRLLPVLEAGLLNAQQLAAELSLTDLLTELSQGVHFDEAFTKAKELVLVPTFWLTPLTLSIPLREDAMMMMFGVRPASMSAIPGELVPDSLLRTLKALADSTRLKILYYIAREELNPSELSRRLHLRAPTVTHHLNELRLAGLVNLTVMGQEKCYSARREALHSIFSTLETFLDGK
jgi:DNA-binding transcriptional ArsR family regulator